MARSGIFQRWFGKAAPKAPRAVVVQPFQTTPRRGSRAVLQSYRENAYLRSVVSLIGEQVSGVRFRVYKRLDAQGRITRDYGLQSAGRDVRVKEIKALRGASELVELPGHEVMRVLTQPSPHMTGRAALQLIQSHLDLVGESFLWLQRDGSGRVVGFEVLPPHAVSQTPTGEQRTFTVSYQSLNGALPESEVIWLKHHDPENPIGRGSGPGLALGDELDTHEHLSRMLKSTFARGGLPLAVMSLNAQDGSDSEEAADDLQKRFNDGFGRPDQAGKVFIAPGQVSMAALNVDNKALDTVAVAGHIQDFIRQVFRLPPEVMGDLTSSNRATAEAARWHLGEYVVSPRVEFLRAELQAKLVPLIDADVVLEYDSVSPQTFERVAGLMSNPTTAPAFQLNEVRELAGYAPAPELDGAFVAPAPGVYLAQEAPGTEPADGPEQTARDANQTPAVKLFRNLV